LTREQFKERWLPQQMKALVLPDAHVEKIVAMTFTGQSVPPGKAPPFDGITELYYESEDDFRKTSPLIIKHMAEGEGDLIDTTNEPKDQPLRYVSEEILIMERPEGKPSTPGPMTKIVRLTSRRPGTTRQQYKDYWLEQHVKATTTSQSPLWRIVATLFTGESVPGGREPPFDSIAELYPKNKDKTAEGKTPPEVINRIIEDEKNFIDVSGEKDWPLLRFFVEEFVLARTAA